MTPEMESVDKQMKLVVCIKQIHQAYARTGMNPAACFFSAKDHIARVNPFDEFALELGLRVKDAAKEPIEIFLLTLGPMIAEKDLRRCLAMGGDHLYWIDAHEPSDVWARAGLLRQAIEDIGPDLILCGKESLDRRCGQAGAFLAHMLKMPFVSAITDLSVSMQDGSFMVQRIAGRGVREEVRGRMPAVASVAIGPHSPRFPSYASRKRACNHPITTFRYKSSAIEPKTSLLTRYPPRPRSMAIDPPDSDIDAFNRIQALLAGSKVEKKGEMIGGDIREQVDHLIAYLQENGFLAGNREYEE